MIIMDDDYLWLTSCWILQPFTFIIQPIERFILELHQHGIITHFENLKSLKEVPKPEDPEPEILTLQMLSAGFIVWISTFIFVIIAFITEHIVFYLQVKSDLKCWSRMITVKELLEDSVCSNTEQSL